MDINIKVDCLPITKLIELFAIATGKVYEPRHIKRMAEANAAELAIMSKVMRENLDLPTKYENVPFTIDATKYEDLVMRARNRQEFQEIQKQQNIESILGNAYQELKQESSVRDAPADKDWTLRFFNSVEDISNEEMQKLWGKILAGEIKQPKTFSLRALEALRCLTSEEAKLFERLSQYAINFGNAAYCFYNNEEFYSKYITVNELMDLGEIGLINFSELRSKNIGITTKKEILVNNKTIVILVQATSASASTKLEIPAYAYTKLGEELIRVIEPQLSDEVLLDFGKIFQKKFPNIKLTAYRIVKIEGENFKLDDNKDLLAEE